MSQPALKVFDEFKYFLLLASYIQKSKQTIIVNRFPTLLFLIRFSLLRILN